MQAATARSTIRQPTSSRRSSDSNPATPAAAGESAAAAEASLLNNGATQQDLVAELERLRKEKIASIYEAEKYKKKISLAIVLAIFGFSVAIGMIIWRHSPLEPTWEEKRQRLIGTPEEESRDCITLFPHVINRTFNVNETGEPLMLTPYIELEKYQEAVEAARVRNVFQTMVSCFYYILKYVLIKKN